jgi:glycosyltransferase involved in cell wall biosynthesis
MSQNHEPLVSVVTPFYNTAEYLTECIESVLNQTYQNWEYILLDNLSSDASTEIVETYAQKDKRIRLFHNECFLNQVQNYNHALSRISSASKYCKVVQADDWIFPDCLSQMVALAEMDDSIGIVAGYRLQGTIITNDGLSYSHKMITGRDVCRQNLLIDGSQIFGSPTTVLMRSEIVKNRNPFYHEDDYFEDSDVCFEILKTWNFGFIHQVTAFERTDNKSLSYRVYCNDPAWLLAKFLRITKYGETFLSKSEFKTRLRTIRKSYFRFLAYNYFCGRGKSFWEYHRKGLASVGIGLSYKTLGKYICLELIDLIFNPKSTAIRVWRAINFGSWSFNACFSHLRTKLPNYLRIQP